MQLHTLRKWGRDKLGSCWIHLHTWPQHSHDEACLIWVQFMYPIGITCYVLLRSSWQVLVNHFNSSRHQQKSWHVLDEHQTEDSLSYYYLGKTMETWGSWFFTWYQSRFVIPWCTTLYGWYVHVQQGTNMAVYIGLLVPSTISCVGMSVWFGT